MIDTNNNNNNSSNSNTTGNSSSSNGGAKLGDIITLDLCLEPENGYIPEPLFDTHSSNEEDGGGITFVLGWGNYLPGLHTLCIGKHIDDVVTNVSIDAGWGERNQDLILTIPKHKLQKRLNNHMDTTDFKVGMKLVLPTNNGREGNGGGGGGIQLIVSEILDDDTVVVDANPPLAGASYSCTFKVLNIESYDHHTNYYHGHNHHQYGHDYHHDSHYNKSSSSLIPTTSTTTRSSSSTIPTSLPSGKNDNNNKYNVCTFALGCFWGAELAFMRIVGVVGTRVGYTQGITINPTYEDVSNGKTKHCEAVLVIYDTTKVTYEELLLVAYDRLKLTYQPSTLLHTMFYQEEEDDDDDNDAEEDNTTINNNNNKNHQYKLGFYVHNPKQKQMAMEFLKQHNNNNKNNNIPIEVKDATQFYDAEEYHQQYLLKGGQSAKKGAKEPIRCYG